MALGFLCALAGALLAYPLRGTWLAPVLLAYAVALWRWPRCWLAALPALLPVLDLAPVTGWFFLEEIDLLLLLTLALTYWRLDPRPPSSTVPGAIGDGAAQWPPAVAPCLALLALACAIGIARGLRPLPPLDANAFTSYLSPYNALRLGKAWCWALLLLAPLRQAVGPRCDGVWRYFLPGMLAGLLLVACADVRERMLFPGLLNFSSDYRTTAPFSAMHTGGAALDGYLALACPLLLPWLVGRDAPLRPALAAALALPLLGLAAYAVLTTFSRGLYAGLGVALLLLLGLALFPAHPDAIPSAGAGGADRRTAGRNGQPAARGLQAVAHAVRPAHAARLMLVPALAAAALTLNAVFAASGYRGLTAALAALAAALLLAGFPLRYRPLIAGAAVGAAAQALLAALLPSLLPDTVPGMLKPPYFLFACFALAFAGALLPALPPPLGRGRIALPLAAGGLLGLLINAAWIAWHWAGAMALPSACGALALALLPLCLNLAAGRPLWRIDRRSAMPGLVALLGLGLVLPICHGYFVAERFDGTAGDLAARMRHWRQVWRVMDDDVPTLLFGMGIGTFPERYFWRAPDTPPSYRYVDRDGNRYLELHDGDYAAGYGEMLRMLHVVAPRPGRDYVLDLDAWNTGPPAFLHVNLCQRLLLYPQHCSVLPLRQLGTGDQWRHVRFTFNSGALGGGTGWLSPPVQLEIAVEGVHAVVGIDNVSLREGDDRRQLIRNGNFSDTNLGWFFSSDHHHLPWHIKNLELNVMFELGLLGVLGLGALLSCCAAQLLRRARRGDVLAAAWLASLAAFLVVGLFDSLFDVPRITLLFLLLLSAGVLRPAFTDARTR